MNQTKIRQITNILIICIVALFTIYIITIFYLLKFSPPIKLSLTLDPGNCDSLDYKLDEFNPLFDLMSPTKQIPLTTGLNAYTFSINPKARNLTWNFCPGSSIVVSKLQIITPEKVTNIPLTDQNHLLCLGCSSLVTSDGLLNLKPTTSRVSLSVTGLNEYISTLMPPYYRLLFRLPLIITALFFILFLSSVINLTINNFEYVIYVLIVELTLIYYWSYLRAIFPLATYSANRIIGGAQFWGFRLNGDIGLGFIFLCIPFLIGFIIWIRNRYLCHRSPSLICRFFTSFVLIFLLFMFIRRYV